MMVDSTEMNWVCRMADGLVDSLGTQWGWTLVVRWVNWLADMSVASMDATMAETTVATSVALTVAQMVGLMVDERVTMKAGRMALTTDIQRGKRKAD